MIRSINDWLVVISDDVMITLYDNIQNGSGLFGA